MSFTNIPGKPNPIATPIAYEAIAIVRANTLSLTPNHTAASLAGAFKINGYPIADIICPRIHIQNP